MLGASLTVVVMAMGTGSINEGEGGSSRLVRSTIQHPPQETSNVKFKLSNSQVCRLKEGFPFVDAMSQDMCMRWLYSYV